MQIFIEEKDQVPPAQLKSPGSRRAGYRRFIQLVVSVGLTIVLGYIIYRDVPDWRRSLQIMIQGSPLLILIGLFFAFLHLVFRAARWGTLLSSTKPHIRFMNLFSLTFVKYVVNLIPPRSGEFAASIVLARKEEMSSATVLAASFFERILDLITVLAIFAAYLALGEPGVSQGSEAGRAIVRSVRSYSIKGFFVLGIGFILLILLLRSSRWNARIPQKIRDPLLRFLEGFRALQSHGTMLRVGLYSLAIWLCITLQQWFFVRAYTGSFPFAGMALIVVLTVVGVAIPTPGGIGGFQYFMNLALVTFFAQYLSSQDPHTQAAGISNGCYFLSMIPVYVVGIIFLNREGLSLGRISSLRETQQ